MDVPLPSGICPLCVFSIKLCPIIGAKHWDNFPGSTVPIKALMWRAKCPIKAWRCPFANFVPSPITVPRNGQKNNTFRDKNIEEICPFPHRRRGMFSFKLHFLLRKKGHFLGVEILGEHCPRPPWFYRPWLFPFRGNENGSRGLFNWAQMWQDKCPAKA